MAIDYNTIWDGYASTSNESSNELPSYLYGADNHNYGNGNFAITDPSTWGEGLDNAGKFIVSAAVSGTAGIYNSGITVANWFGADAKELDVGATLSSIDTDLGEYYSENKQSVDMAGFVVSSLVPGLAGTKLLNAGQRVLKAASNTGFIGANLSKATGLLAPDVQTYVQLAKADIASSSSAFSAISGNTLKAITAGYGQAALESAAFEIAVVATSFKSPVLEESDAWDIAKNVALGTVVGGVIGGALTNATTIGAIKKGAKDLNPIEKLFTDTSDVTGLGAAQRIIVREQHINSMPAAPTAENILEGNVHELNDIIVKLPANDQTIIAKNLETKFNRLREETQTSLKLKNREDIHELTTGNDIEIANLLADTLRALPANQTFANFEHLTELGRVSTKLKAQKEIEKFDTQQVKELVDISGPIDSAPFKLGYVKLNGEGAGNVTFEEPKVLNIADTVRTKEDVLKEVGSYKFKVDKVFSSSEVANHYEAEARFIWADRLPALKDGVKIGEHDIPLLEKAIENKLDSITVISPKFGEYTINSAEDIFKHLQVSKQEVALQLQGKALTTPEIAKITNVRSSFLDGDINTTNPANDYFARQTDKSAYEKQLIDSGVYNESKVDSFDLSPSYVKAAYDTKAMKDIDGNLVQGMAYIKAQQKMYQQGVDNAFVKHTPAELVDRFWAPPDELLLKANRTGEGPGIFTFANGGYNSVGSWTQSIGSATSDLQKALKNSTTSTLESSLYKIGTNAEVAVEFESINKYIQSTSELYGLTPEGTGIAPLKLLDWQASVANGVKNLERPVLQEGAKPFIEIKSPDVLNAWKTRTDLTGNRTTGFQEIRNAQGLTDMKDPRALRAIRYDPKDYPFYAVVVDPAITGVGHKSMIHAASAKELESMISKVPGNYEVYKGDQLKQFFKAQGEFDFEKTLHENYIDADLKSKGVNNPFFIRTDPQKIANSFLQDHLRSDDIFAREMVNAKFEKEFTFLRQQGDQFTNTATSRYTGSYRDIENTTNNPYINYIKTALNVSQVSEYPLIAGLNTALDTYATKAINLISDTFTSSKSVEELDKVNTLLNKYGVSSAYYDAATELFANHSAPRGALVKFVGRANSIISTLVTRLDPLNAINNAIGATVLYGSETKSFLKAMQGVRPEIAGELGGLLKTPVPSEAALAGQSTEVMTTAGKLMLNSIKNFTDKTATTLGGEKLKEFYSRNGWSTKLTDQFHSIMDDIALVGTEDVGALDSKIKSAFASAKVLAEKGEILTGNKLAEEFNRFVSADTMRQMTDIGIKAGRITEKEQIGYINTFVNRTQGNTLASQRPLMFQGAVGQAIGLFQSYQFNIMQQLFRHVSEGASKDAAMLLGLQGTMYGMNGLPAFNYLNTHILGTASGNPAHRDAYDVTYGIAGKEVGNILMYGIPSNLLRANLYSRGDINPRQLTVIPTNPLDIPFVNATIKTYDNVKAMMGNIEGGGNIWQSMLQGIEHNGLSRPLSGIAQTAQAINNEAVFSTTGSGSISSANDLYSWSTAVRLAGGKPFESAVANDSLFRMTAYQAVDRERKDNLVKAIRTAVIGNEHGNEEQYQQFAEKYASLGGSQTEFNKYMLKQIKEANTNKANKIMENMKSPYSKKMQEIMGGEQLMDGNNF